MGRKARLLPSQHGCLTARAGAGTRRERRDDDCAGGGQGERGAALPSPTHAPDRTKGPDFVRVCLETISALLWLGEWLQSSGDIARVPNL